MKISLIFLLAIGLSLFSIGTTASAAVKAGAACTKAGAISIVSGKKFTCIKSGGKLVWNKGVVVAAPKAPSQSPASSPKPSSTPTSTPASEGANSLVSDITPSVGRGIAPPGARGNGPWAAGIRFATSTDGVTFSPTGEILTDQAGVPNLVVGSDKKLRCYYVNFQGNQIVVAIQVAPGKWIYKKVHVENLPGDNFPPNLPVDPSVVVLPDGSYRLYYMQLTRQLASGPDTSILSAVSSDGINFKREAGIRLARIGPDKNVYDPTVLITPTTTYLWSGPDGAHFATSSDGKNWKLEPNSTFKADIGVAAVDATHWIMAYLVLLPQG